jgi:hypothetical protein
MHVLKNVKVIQRWIIANNVLKPVGNVLRNAEEWLLVVKDLEDNQRKLFSIFNHFFFW